MKLLMTADTVGGVWTYALELARALSPEGVEVHLATMGAPLTGDQWREADSISGLRIYESRCRLEWMDEPWADLDRAGEWLLSLESEIRPDLVHLNQYAHGVLPWRAPKLVVGHSDVLSWWQAVRRAPAPAGWRRYGEAVRAGLRAAGLVAAPTRAMLAALETHYGPFGATQVIPNGREPADFPPGVKEPFIFSAGRLWDEAKNVGAVAEVASEVPWPVFVAGEQAHPSGARLELQSVRGLGRLTFREMGDWLGRATLYALPARYEPFGLSVLEAGLAGCALVVGDIPSLREVWGDAALFVHPDDREGLRAALQRLIDDPALRQEMARQARTRAFEYTPQRMGKGYLSAYRWLLAAAEPGTAREDEEVLCAS